MFWAARGVHPPEVPEEGLLKYLTNSVGLVGLFSNLDSVGFEAKAARMAGCRVRCPLVTGQGARGRGRHPGSIRRAVARRLAKSKSICQRAGPPGARNRLPGERKPLVAVAAASTASAGRTGPGLVVARHLRIRIPMVGIWQGILRLHAGPGSRKWHLDNRD